MPGVQWGAPAWECSFAESLNRRDKLLPLISKWAPEAMVGAKSPPMYFEYDWGLFKPDRVGEMDYLVHSPRWGLGFQKMARERGAVCYLRFPGHPSEKYADMWEFLLWELGAGAKVKAVAGKVGPGWAALVRLPAAGTTPDLSQFFWRRFGVAAGDAAARRRPSPRPHLDAARRHRDRDLPLPGDSMVPGSPIRAD